MCQMTSEDIKHQLNNNNETITGSSNLRDFGPRQYLTGDNSSLNTSNDLTFSLGTYLFLSITAKVTIHQGATQLIKPKANNSV